MINVSDAYLHSKPHPMTVRSGSRRFFRAAVAQIGPTWAFNQVNDL
jgi:hypothetical protein